MVKEPDQARRTLRQALVLTQIGAAVNGICFFGFFMYLNRVRPAGPVREFRIEMSNHGDLYFISVADAWGLLLLAVLATICLFLGLWAQAALQRMSVR